MTSVILRSVVATCLASLALASSAQVYRWVDEKGRTHYGDEVQPAYRPRARPVELQKGPTPEQTRDAKASVAKQLDAAKPRPTAGDVPGQQNVEAPSATSASGTNQPRPESCDEKWRRYEESSTCFSPYRNANGSVKAEGFEKCREVKAPEYCGDRPSFR